MQSSIMLEIMKYGLLQSIQSIQFSVILRIKLYDVGDQKTTLASQDQAKYQAEDKWIHLVVQFKKKGEYPDKHAYKQLPRESKILLGEWDNLQMHEDILYRQKQQQPRQLILPSKLKPLVHSELHVNMGHLGTYKIKILLAING